MPDVVSRWQLVLLKNCLPARYVKLAAVHGAPARGGPAGDLAFELGAGQRTLPGLAGSHRVPLSELVDYEARATRPPECTGTLRLRVNQPVFRQINDKPRTAPLHYFGPVLKW